MNLKKLILKAPILLVIVFLTACTNLDAPEFTKTEFKLNENASIDHYEIKLISQNAQPQYNDVTSTNGQYITLTFEIKNTSKKNDNINKDNFYLEKNKVIYPASLINPGTIKSNETKEYTVIFDVPYDNYYEILFYSNIVTNNIQFDIEF